MFMPWWGAEDHYVDESCLSLSDVLCEDISSVISTASMNGVVIKVQVVNFDGLI